MSENVKTCPSCNYAGEPETSFDVCPRCGLIIAKYLHRQSQCALEVATTKSSDVSFAPSVLSRFLKVAAAIILGALLVFLMAAFLNKFMKSPSGTIAWTKEYYEGSSETSPSFAHGMAIGDDFLYLVGSYGRSDTHTAQWSMQKRTAADGMLVPQFGEGGIVKSAFGLREDYAKGVAIDSEYIYVIGRDRTPWGEDRSRRLDMQWRMEKRRLSDGSLVAGFGDSGVVTSNLTPYYEEPEAISVDKKYVYVAGTEVANENDYQWRIEKRLLSDGSLSSDFGDGGIVRSNPNAAEGYVGSEHINAMTIGSGCMYVAGLAYNSAPTDTCWRIEKRRLGDGLPSAEFGTEGSVTSNPSQTTDVPLGIAIDEKSMYIVGFDTSNGRLHPRWRLEKRSLSDGTLATEFGIGGVVTSGSLAGKANGVVLEQEPTFWEKVVNLDLSDHQRNMYVIGVDGDARSGPHGWRIEKRKMNNGALCTEFGNKGVVKIDTDVELKQARLIASDRNYIYVSGFTIGTHTSRIMKIKK